MIHDPAVVDTLSDLVERNADPVLTVDDRQGDRIVAPVSGQQTEVNVQSQREARQHLRLDDPIEPGGNQEIRPEVGDRRQQRHGFRVGQNPGFAGPGQVGQRVASRETSLASAENDR